MLDQQVNLYQAFATTGPALNFLSWKRYWQIQAIFLSFLCLMYLISAWQVHTLKNEKLALQTQVNELQKKFFELKKNYPPVFFSQDVGQNVKSLKDDLELQKKILGSLVMPIYFSQNLIAFATNIVPDVWLTGINLSKSGNIITLKGMTTNIELLQKFITNLMNNKLFSDFIVNMDDITRPDKNNEKNNLTFQLTLKHKSQ